MRKKTIVSRIMNNSAATKLRSNSGESIVETLVTMIILSLAVVMLSGAVVTSARVNQRAENADTAFISSQNRPVSHMISISKVTGEGANLNVNLYQTENGYIYYESQ